MESNVIRERKIGDINISNDNRVRIVGKIEQIDSKTGIFVLSDTTGTRITCLPSPVQENMPPAGSLVVLTGRAASAGEREIELRTEHVEVISEKEYLNYYSYLNLKEELIKQWK